MSNLERIVTEVDAEAGLVARALGGERAAWDQLISRYRRRVVVALLAEGLSLEQADEVCQEAWSRLWAQQQRGGLDRLELPGLAVTQARFIARDGYRRARLAESIPPGDEATGSPDAAAISRQQLEQVARALGTFPVQQQRIFRLAQHEGLPHADIAERVGLSLQRVRQIIFEVRVKLRAQLEAP
jgi:RNA polymerase sigma-70 factor (ECF subfamily)